jgi:hypothetical protein
LSVGLFAEMAMSRAMKLMRKAGVKADILWSWSWCTFSCFEYSGSPVAPSCSVCGPDQLC